MSSAKTRKVLFKAKTLVDAAQDQAVGDSVGTSIDNWNGTGSSIYQNINSSMTGLVNTLTTELGASSGTGPSNVRTNMNTYFNTLRDGNGVTGTGAIVGYQPEIFGYLNAKLSESRTGVVSYFDLHYNNIHTDLLARRDTKAMNSTVEALDEYAKVIVSAMDFQLPDESTYQYTQSRVQGISFVADQYAPDLSSTLSAIRASNATIMSVNGTDTIYYNRYLRVYLLGNKQTGSVLFKIDPVSGNRILIRQGGLSRAELINVNVSAKYFTTIGLVSLHDYSSGEADCDTVPSSAFTIAASASSNPTPLNLKDAEYYYHPWRRCYISKMGSTFYKIGGNDFNNNVGKNYAQLAPVFGGLTELILTTSNITNADNFVIDGVKTLSTAEITAYNALTTFAARLAYLQSLTDSTKKRKLAVQLVSSPVSGDFYEITGVPYDLVPIKPRYAAELVHTKDKIYLQNTTGLLYVHQSLNRFEAGYVPLYTKYGQHFKRGVYKASSDTITMVDLMKYDCFYFAGSDYDLTGEEKTAVQLGGVSNLSLISVSV